MHMRKSQRIAGLLMAAGFLTVSDVCRAAEEITMRTLAKGGFSGITNKQQLVITNQPAWQQFWAKHNVTVKSVEKAPPVDFEKEMVVAITMGQQRTGGYRIEITTVEAQPDKLIIAYKRYAPPPDGINLQVITSPFHFVAIPKSDLKAEFTEAEK
jgi:hypothetical protein